MFLPINDINLYNPSFGPKTAAVNDIEYYDLSGEGFKMNFEKIEQQITGIFGDCKNG